MLAISGTNSTCSKPANGLMTRMPPQRVPQPARVASEIALMLSIIAELRYMLPAGTAEGGTR
jgi:hypothetical protein